MVLFREQGEYSQETPSVAMFLGKISGILGDIDDCGLNLPVCARSKTGLEGGSPGSILFFVLWTCVVAFFRYYVHSFSYYSLVSGALGVVIVILLSAYFVAFTLLLGGELNAAILRLRSDK